MSKGEGKKKFFPNGYYTNEDWIRLVSDRDKFDAYQRKFNTGKDGNKCPPIDLTSDGVCYYCYECQNESAQYVKEYKKHFMVKNLKYLKTDLGEELDETR